MTIIPRGNKFGVKVRDSTRRQRWVGTFPSRELAERAEADAVGARSSALTVAQWGRVWLSDYARSARATQRTYRYAVERIIADLGSLRLDRLDRPTARRFANRWARNTTRVARTMWGDAVRDGKCDINPFSDLRLETPRGRKDIDALTEPEIQTLAELARAEHGDYGDEAAAIILTLGYVGVRPGELCALRRPDLDVAIAELVVRFSLDSTRHEKAPKNGLGRIVIVPPPALDAIGLVPPRLDSDYLFHTPTGRRLSKATLHYLWRPIRAGWTAQGGRHIDLYDLRHACATLLLERGLTPADVAYQLGHTDGGRLVQVLYGHPAEDRARERLKMAFATAPGSEHGRRIAASPANRPDFADD